jgi:hypothetical protein
VQTGEVPDVCPGCRHPHPQRDDGQGTKHALNCKNMTLAWREWICHLIVDHTWNNWKLHWATVFAEMRNINCMTACKTAIANQAATQDIMQAEKRAVLLDSLANVFIQKYDTVKKLVATNQQQAKTIANLTADIAKLKAGETPNGPGQECPLHWGATRPA